MDSKKSITGEYKNQKKEYKKEYKLKKREAKRAYKEQKRLAKAERDEQKNIAKSEYGNKKTEIRSIYLSSLDAYYSSEEFLAQANPPRRAVIEEIGNAVTHGIGSVFSIIAYVLLLLKSTQAVDYIAASVYFFGMFVMFTMSCLYHAFAYGSKVKRVFRRFDYSSIYLLIGATFAPILLCFVGGAYGLVFFIAQWVIIATGITLVGVFGPTRLRWLHIPLYVLLGWSALLFVPRMISNCLPLFFWVIGGGLTYSLGIIPFALKKKVAHFIWHFFVLIGAVVFWIGIYSYVF